jgi:large conductance mechanosensitive channel
MDQRCDERAFDGNGCVTEGKNAGMQLVELFTRAPPSDGASAHPTGAELPVPNNPPLLAGQLCRNNCRQFRTLSVLIWRQFTHGRSVAPSSVTKQGPDCNKTATGGPRQMSSRPLTARPLAARPMTLVSDFKKFLLRGNVVDLAVAVVVGTAFTAVVKALVSDLLTPVIAVIFGKPSFSALTFTINNSHFQYGDFLNNLIAFLTVTAAMFFFVVAPINALLARRAQADPDEKECPECTSAIPIRARRCPMCTSQLAPPPAGPPILGA